VSRLTKGTIEAEIANAVVRFQREQTGRGPTDVRAHLLGDLILVRSGGIFTPVETKLAVTEDGRKIIKVARQELRDINRSEIEQILGDIVGCTVVRSYCDVDVEAAEQVEVYVLDADLEKRLLRQDLDHLNGLTSRRSAQ
jgi:uncharacterized protein YbcI